MKRPLRIAAIAILTVSLAAASWLLLGGAGLADDPFYADAHAREALPFAFASAAVALLVFVASGTARSRGRWAALGLWLALAGAFLVLASLLGGLATSATLPRRLPDLDAAFLLRVRLFWLATAAGGLSLIAGGALWLLSYRLDGPRGLH